MRMPSADRMPKSYAIVKIRARSNGNGIFKTIYNKSKKPLNLQIRSLRGNEMSPSGDAPLVNSFDKMIEQIELATQSIGNEIEKQFKKNPLVENTLNEEQELPDNLNGINTELNDKVENTIMRLDHVEQQIRAFIAEFEEEKANRLKLSEEIDQHHKCLLDRIAYLEEKLQEKIGNNQMDIDIIQNALPSGSQQTNEPIIQHENIPLVENTSIDDDISIMPQLVKEIDDQNDIEIIGEVFHDYKIGLPPFKKENEVDRITEWPVLTLKSDCSENYEKGSSTRNYIIPINIKNENDTPVDPRPSTSKYVSLI